MIAPALSAKLRACLRPILGDRFGPTSPPGPPPAHGDSILLESGDYLLLESGSTVLKE